MIGYMKVNKNAKLYQIIDIFEPVKTWWLFRIENLSEKKF